jgi:hypothetical protein
MMTNLIRWFTAAYEEHSIAFVFLSALVGGLIGASLKLLFEFLIPEGMKARREARAIVARYRSPIVRAADALRGRIGNLLSMSGLNWFEESEYYRLSTLYVFCDYFGWVEILCSKVAHLRFESSRKNRRLSMLLNGVDKAFNNRTYFGDLEFDDIPDDSDVPKFACKALGELMISDCEKEPASPIGFVEFCRRSRSEGEFRSWLGNLDKFLRGVRKSPDNLKWDRLLVIELSLIALINFLDPHHELARCPSPESTVKIADRIQRKRVRQVLVRDCRVKRLPVVVEGGLSRVGRIIGLRGKALRTPRWFSRSRADGGSRPRTPN